MLLSLCTFYTLSSLQLTNRVISLTSLLSSMYLPINHHHPPTTGVDCNGPHLYSIHPHGSTQRLPYTTMGSGSLAAMAIFESRFVEDMEEVDAIQLVKDAIRAGIFNDLGSGSNVDVTVIRKDNNVSRFRTIENAAGDASTYKAMYTRPAKMNPPAGTTFVIEESFRPHTKKPEATISTSAMDVA